MTILATKKPTQPMPPLAYDNAYLLKAKSTGKLALAIHNPKDASSVILINDIDVGWVHAAILHDHFDIVACVSMSEIDINVPVNPL